MTASSSNGIQGVWNVDGCEPDLVYNSAYILYNKYKTVARYQVPGSYYTHIITEDDSVIVQIQPRKRALYFLLYSYYQVYGLNSNYTHYNLVRSSRCSVFFYFYFFSHHFYFPACVMNLGPSTLNLCVMRRYYLGEGETWYPH